MKVLNMINVHNLHCLFCVLSVPPKISMSNTERVLLEVPASSQLSLSGEEVITLDLDVAGLNTVAEEQVTPISRTKGKRAQKRTYESTNTAPDYGNATESVSDNQYYPAHLFQTVPSQLQTDNLRKKALVSIIKSNEAVIGLVESLKGCVGPLKNALLVLSGQGLPPEQEDSDHAYQVHGASAHGNSK